MAEHVRPESLTRRVSIRKTLGDFPFTSEQLHDLELKRRQLDESIHRHIAAKEREWKQAVKDARQQTKHQLQDKDGKPESARRRTSSEPAQDNMELPLSLGKGSTTGETLLSAGIARGEDDRTLRATEDEMVEGLESRSSENEVAKTRHSIGREKDLLGVFTPAFLPALDGKAHHHPGTERTYSAPLPADSTANALVPDQHAAPVRSSSDTALQDSPKRPANLHLLQRTSSSGSSHDSNRLTSVLKSPTQASRAKRKRVSLAVGDAIVAPSDSVPLALAYNSTPSHSRNRVQVTEQENIHSSSERGAEPPRRLLGSDSGIAQLSTMHEGQISQTQQQMKDLNISIIPDERLLAAPETVSPKIAATTSASRVSFDQRSSKALAKKLDPDGDLFDLEDEIDEERNEANQVEDEQPDLDFDMDEDVDMGAGRHQSLDGVSRSKIGGIYESSEGIVPVSLEDDEVEPEPDIEFRPGSTQQPTHPGFRRPSATIDPKYSGNNYARAEQNAVVNEVYGSSYSRPTSKGSFSAGSLGESFMARNAEHLRTRAAQEQATVR